MNEKLMNGMAGQACCQESTAGFGSVGKTAHRSLSDRLQRRRELAEMESRRLEQLSELLYLLDKNPEVARILDLIDAVGQ